MADQALQQLADVQAAIADGDLEQAQHAVLALQPIIRQYVAARNSQQLQSLREQIGAITLEVYQVRQDTQRQMRQLNRQQGAVSAYQTTAAHT